MTNASAVQTIGHEIAAAQFRSIPLAEIEPSPSNPRKTFAGLDELANDFKIRGVLLPLIVRPMGKGFECVAGERRLRAAKLAKLATVPAIVRELSDLEVLEIQIVENAKRQDIHPVEEAEAYRTLRDVHKLSVAEISAKVGRPVGTVYERLKLCELAPEVRKAALAGELPASHAVLIARIPDKKLQAEALAQMLDGGGDAPSYRDAFTFVHRTYMMQLATAPFDTTNQLLVPEAGPCTTCPKRTGNQPELFADIKAKDTCTDPGCYAAKVKATAEVKLGVIEKEGAEVLRGVKAEKLFGQSHDGTHYVQHNCGYVAVQPGQQYVENRGYFDVAKVLRDNPKIKTVTVANPDNAEPMQLVSVKALPKPKPRSEASGKPREESPVAKAKRDAAEAEERLKTDVRRAIVGAVVEKAKAKKPDRKALAFIVLQIAPIAEHYEELIDRRGIKRLGSKFIFEKAVKAMDEKQLWALLVETAIAADWDMIGAYEHRREGSIVEAAKLYGVDHKKVASEAEALHKARSLVARSCPICHAVVGVKEGRFVEHKNKDGKKCAASGIAAVDGVAPTASKAAKAKGKKK